MDAWYPHLIDALLPQVTAIDDGGADPTSCSGSRCSAATTRRGRRARLTNTGYYEMMKRVLQMSLAAPGTPTIAPQVRGYGPRRLPQRGVTSLTQALADLGGWAARDKWDGTTLVNAQTVMAGETVETYDAIPHQGFSLLPVATIPWVNRPTFQQVVEVR